MSIDPVDRSDEVNTFESGKTQFQPAVENSIDKRYEVVNRQAQFIGIFFGLLAALLGIRILLRLNYANPASSFVRFIDTLTGLFLWPFSGLVTMPGVGQVVLDIPALIAMLVYLLLGWLLVRLIWLLLYRPGNRMTQTYRRD